MGKFKIKTIKARQIFDSRGEKTIEVELITNFGKFLASAPSGTSKGKFEAPVVDPKKAIENIHKFIAPKLKNKSSLNQKEIDQQLDKKLGANATLAVSMALARAAARERKLSLWKYISKIALAKPKLPQPCVLLIEGGLHGKTTLDIQEFMVIPEGKSFQEKFLIAKKIYKKLKKILIGKFGKKGIILGLEGAFTPPLSDVRDALDLIMKACADDNFKIGLDCAVSNIKKGKYSIAFYQKLVKDYPILFLEDPFREGEWGMWQKLSLKLKNQNSKLLVVGDDLTATNPARIKMARKKKACNAVVIKPNQIGTVSEAVEAAKLAKSYGWKVIVSHRSGETKDDFISDFAVGIGADFIKAGAPSKPERMTKYNRLSKIEKEF